MNSRPHPQSSVAAVDRVRALGEKAFVQFLDEVSPRATEALAGYLPPVRGFRRTSKSGIKQRKLALAKEFASNRPSTSKSRSLAEQGLYAFWRAWAMEQLGDPAGTAALLDTIEEVVEHEKEDDGVSGVAPQIVNLFSALNERSLNNECPREKIERLFAFSPFDETPEIRTFIDSAKPSSDIDREVALKAIPRRLEQDEAEIKSLEARQGPLSTRMGAADADLRVLRKEVTALHSGATQLAAGIKDVRETLDAVARSVRSATEANASESRDANARAQELSERLARLSADWEATAQSVAKIATDTSTDEWIALFERRVEALEQKQAVLPPHTPLSDIAIANPTTSAVAAASSIARARKFLISSEPKVLASVTDAAEILAGNLETVGLRKSAAQALAEEISAAALAAQAVFLKGALATEVARLCARTLGGRNGLRVSMPVGLSDGDGLGVVMRREVDGSGESVAAVAIEGINRSALDVFADALSDIAAGDREFIGGVHGPALVFASVTEGPASLAVDPRYLELGPIFDLDAKNVESDEALRLLRKFAPRKNPRIERVVALAITALESLGRRQRLPSPLQSLAFGWLVPFWATLGLSKEDVDTELDGGKCDSATPDPRLTSILAGIEFPSEKAGRE